MGVFLDGEQAPGYSKLLKVREGTAGLVPEDVRWKRGVDIDTRCFRKAAGGGRRNVASLSTHVNSSMMLELTTGDELMDLWG
jgi:hypothetical protein